MIDATSGAAAIAAAVASREVSAVEVARAALQRIDAGDRAINAFTSVTAERALAEAAAVDARVARGGTPPPLAGVPYAAKDLFDIAGVVTLAGSKINRDLPPAGEDAVLIQRMREAGAVLLGGLNMDEYAYGFTTENAHYGPTRNPRDPSCIAGGSSGGSAAAVAAGFVPITLGSDTNGSIRVPSSLCGIFGLKPTYGRLTRRGSYPFVASLDHLGPFARSAADLAASYDALQGPDRLDPACAQREREPTLPGLGQGIDELRIAALDDYFEHNAGPQALAARDAVCAALKVSRRLTLPEAARARAAAFVITCSEGGSLHLDDLRRRPGDFDPATRDRLLAGTLIPAAWVGQAQRFRRWFLERALEVFRDVDVLIAPATPLPAVPIGTEYMELRGERILVRPNMGLLTQPISFIGLPVVCVPVPASGRLPIGVQIIAAPWQEALALRVAARLETTRNGQRRSGKGLDMIEINLPDVVAEVTAVFQEYETALVTNDVAVLDRLFWNSEHTIRYGGGENLIGYKAIQAFRAARSPAGLGRRLVNTVITTYGRDFATANTEFLRETASGAQHGRQSQTWARRPEGWRVVSAHVSLLPAAMHPGGASS